MNQKAAFNFLFCLIGIASLLTGIRIRKPAGGRAGALNSNRQSAARLRAMQVYNKLPLRFEADDRRSGDGSADYSAVKFVSRGNGDPLWLKPTEAVLVATPGPSDSNALTFSISTTATPALTSLLPASIAAGSGGFQLTVNGSGFIPGSEVRWNGSARTTAFVSISVLQATITAADIASAGSAAITVFTPPPGGGSSNSLPFTIIGNPIINQNGFVNGASFVNLPPAPGSIVSLFGSVFSTTTAAATALPLPLTLGGVTVRINGASVPLFSVSPQQINFQLPWELRGQTQATITVTAGTLSSAPVTISLASYGPAIFATNQQGFGQGAILISQTGELAGPASSGGRPVNRGEFISIYATGLGPVNNKPGTGEPGGVGATITTSAVVSIGGVNANVAFAGLAPNYVGLYQVNAQVPQGAPSGSAVPVSFVISGVATNIVSIAVQ